MIKVIKIIILLIAETVCLITFVAMCFNNRTLQSVVPRAQWHQNPTTENRLAYEQAGRDDLRFLWTVILNASP